MKTWIADRRRLAIAVFVLSVLALSYGGVGAVAVLQLGAILDGGYDPVKDDGMKPEDIPRLKRRLGWVGVTGVVAGVVGLFGLWATSETVVLVRRQ